MHFSLRSNLDLVEWLNCFYLLDIEYSCCCIPAIYKVGQCRAEIADIRLL